MEGHEDIGLGKRNKSKIKPVLACVLNYEYLKSFQRLSTIALPHILYMKIGLFCLSK